MDYLACEKRRHVIRRERDGSQCKLYRCAHKLSYTYSQEVSSNSCQQCVLRIAELTKLNPLCAQLAPLNPIYLQPVFGPQQEIIYQQKEGCNPPSCPHGYHVDANNAWVFLSDWISCPYRIYNNILNSTGEVIIHAVCNLTKQQVTCDDCTLCGSKIESIPEFPKLSTQLSNYWHAVKQWIIAGRPERTDAEVKQIHEDFCVKCDWYDSQRCRGCGCAVKPEGMAIFNKIKMASEHCPKQLW